MQEDKEMTFDAIETVENCLVLFTGMLATMKFRNQVMAKSAMNGFTNATDAADYLVMKGVPFRDAHSIIGRLVLYCIEKNTCIDALSLEELQSISEKFEEDIYDAVSLETCVNKRLTIGAPGPEAMKQVITKHKTYLEEA
jgi:argininosuccinate lyase